MDVHRNLRCDSGRRGCLNSFILAKYDEAFDVYPDILLNLFLSMLAATQAPIILMSQTDRKRRIGSLRNMTTKSI